MVAAGYERFKRSHTTISFDDRRGWCYWRYAHGWTWVNRMSCCAQTWTNPASLTRNAWLRTPGALKCVVVKSTTYRAVRGTNVSKVMSIMIHGSFKSKKSLTGLEELCAVVQPVSCGSGTNWDEVIWDLWCTKWHCYGISPSTSVYIANSLRIDCCTLITVYRPGLVQ
jgi:hypothetical protein